MSILSTQVDKTANQNQPQGWCIVDFYIQFQPIDLLIMSVDPITDAYLLAVPGTTI